MQPFDAEEIRRMLIERVEVRRQAVGFVVGVLDLKGKRVVAYGKNSHDGNATLSGDTIFEVGSLTKVFTSLLLQEMVLCGEVALEDPVAKYLPAEARVPNRNGREITLIDLSTHTSGLPRLPSNLRPRNRSNPYIGYTADLLCEFLASYRLTRDIGSEFEYSNLGGGLLGLALARRAGTDYEQLVRARITSVLGMDDTTITLSAEMRRRLAVGHDASLAAVPNWDMAVLAGAGGLRSSAHDLLTFLAANLGYVDSPLASAMSSMLLVRRPAGMPRLETALGWMISRSPNRLIVWHNGGTGGYRSYMGYDAMARTGVVVLANTATQTAVDDIGMYLLRANCM